MHRCWCGYIETKFFSARYQMFNVEYNGLCAFPEVFHVCPFIQYHPLMTLHSHTAAQHQAHTLQ